MKVTIKHDGKYEELDVTLPFYFRDDGVPRLCMDFNDSKSQMELAQLTPFIVDEMIGELKKYKENIES